MNTNVRQELLTTVQQTHSLGLNHGTAGNVSVRDGAGFLITPSALPHDRCLADDLVWISHKGKEEGRRKPSSEWRMHSSIYHHFAGAGAILHAHAPCCTTLACLERPIPAFHYMIAIAGGDDIRCAAYATFGTQALSDGAIAALQGRKAALLAHHGMICYAADLPSVLSLAVEVEALARMYVMALQIAEPPQLTAEAMSEVLLRFKEYKP